MTNALSNGYFIAQVPLMVFFLGLAAHQGYNTGKLGSHSFCSRVAPQPPLTDRFEVSSGECAPFILSLGVVAKSKGPSQRSANIEILVTISLILLFLPVVRLLSSSEWEKCF